ncbi:WbqC family protein [Cytophagaceae bacterium ABcell3]|nr:WbqC family protein [Cytophagaceae bacterium ABcell3]
MDLLVELHYFPNVDFFAQAVKNGSVCIEACENYQKQTYRNRCYILGANKVQLLTVPVKKSGKKVGVREVEIDYTTSWRNNHLRSIVSAYGKAPYFEFYIDYVTELFNKKHQYLFDLNLEAFYLCIHLLQIEIDVKMTENYIKKEEIDVNQYIDQRDVFQPGKKNQLNDLGYVQYYQVFGKEFVPGLSILDLLFCEGPGSKEIIGNIVR